MYSLYKQEYIRTSVGNSILWGLSRQNSKFVIDDAQPLSFQVFMHSTLNTFSSLAPEAPSFWLAFQARLALCLHVFVKVQCSTSGSTLEDKCFYFFSTDWRWQWWRTSNSAVTAFIAKRPRVAYSCSYVLLVSSNLPLSQSCQSYSWWSRKAKRRIFPCIDNYQRLL